METYRRFWDMSFDKLDAHLKRIQTTEREEDQNV
jgi:hypothetical protein